jgi:hypothetical protein
MYALYVISRDLSTEEIAESCVVALDKFGFEVQNIVSGDGIDNIEQLKTERFEIAKLAIDEFGVELRYPEKYNNYNLALIQIGPEHFVRDVTVQRDIEELIEILVTESTSEMIYLGTLSDDILPDSNDLDNKPGLGYMTFFSNRIAKNFGVPIPNAPGYRTEDLGDGYIIIPSENMMEETRRKETASYLGTKYIR